MKRIAIALVFASLVLPAAAQMKAMDMKDMDIKMEKGTKKAATKAHHAVGVVKSVNADKGTISVDHEAVPSMNWPAMNMTFKAKDKKALQGLKPGQKVEFDFEQQGKNYVITKVN